MAKNDPPPNALSERLNNKELLELLPHLQLDELLLIHVKKAGAWDQMFGVTYMANTNELSKIRCNICPRKLEFNNFTNHLGTACHKTALLEVEQFFHPFYTYAKTSENLAKGEIVSKEELQNAIGKAQAVLAKTEEHKLLLAKRIAKHIKGLEGESPATKLEEQISSLVLQTDVKKPEHIYADASLPLLELLKLEFSIKEGEWNHMVTTANPHLSGKYLCELCSRKCTGIITVNSHFNGYIHKCMQLDTLGVRHPTYSHLTKNCTYRYDEKYSLAIKAEGRTLFKKKADGILESSKRDSSDVDELKSNTSALPSESIKTEKSEAVLDGKSELDEVKNCDGKNNLNAPIEHVVNPLSSAVAKKIKELNAQHNVNIDNEGLIGVEYVVKIIKSDDDPMPMYECCLCEIVLNEARMQGHLIGNNHRLKYCEMHYPDTIKKYRDVIGHIKYFGYINVMGYILERVASAIEKHHGRSIPSVIPSKIFTKMRSEIVSKVYSFRHATQQHGPSFSNAMSAEEVKELVKQKKVYHQTTVPLYHRGRFTAIPTDKVYLNQRSHGNNFRKDDLAEKSELIKTGRSRSPRVRYESAHKHRTRSRSPQSQVFKRDHKRLPEENSRDDIWKIYREKILIAASEVESIYMQYRKNPESHPLYDQEWNRFWRRRKEDIVSQGLDHRSYNYQPEWVQFFRQRLEELFGEALHKAKIGVRKRLNIPLDAEEDSNPDSNKSQKGTAQHLTNSQSHLVIAEPRSKKQCLDIDNLVSQWNSQSNSAVSWSPNDNQIPMWTESSWRQNPLTYNTESTTKQQMVPHVVDDKPNIIHVLRLITALEDHLGSLGSKIMDLLTKALVLEKSCSNNPAELEKNVLTASNCTLLETAVEKLKGILYAGLVDGNKVQSFNRIIEYTAGLLKHADEMGWRTVTTDDSESSSGKNELQKLIEVMQNKRSGRGSSANQKSLPDTLMELISLQRKGTSNDDETSNIDSKHLNFSNLTSQINEKRGKHSLPLNRSTFSSTNVDDRFKQNNAYNNAAQININSSDRQNLLNFNRNPSNFNNSDNLRIGNGGGNGVGSGMSNRNGCGRNNFNNFDFNNRTNANVIGNMNPTRNANAYGSGEVPNSSRPDNYTQITNVDRTQHAFGHSFGNGNGNGNNNWGRFSGNSQQWTPIQQQSNQYNKFGNGNMRN